MLLRTSAVVLMLGMLASGAEGQRSDSGPPLRPGGRGGLRGARGAPPAERQLLQRQTLFDVVGRILAQQFVHETAGLSRVARNFRQAFFTVIQLFEHRHRDVEIVLVKVEQTARVVHQDR